MSRTREPLSRPWSVILITLAVAAAAALAAVLGAVAGDVLGNGGPGTPSPAAAAGPAPIAADEVQAAFETALDDGVIAGDRAAWRAALPARGKAKAGLASIWRHLAPLDWGELGAQVTAIPGRPGVFEVEITGTPGGAGPRDRIVADRVLAFERRSGGGIAAVGDPSPAGTKTQYLMAFRRPRMLRGDGAVIVYEASWAATARSVAAVVPGARRQVARVLGERTDKPMVVFVHSSSAQAADYLADPSFDDRVTFFSRLPTTLSRHAWTPGDIGVIAPKAAGQDLHATLTHETTHAVTGRLFFDTRHDPMLLAEGLAVATADKRSYLPLRNDLLDGRLSIPLLDAFALSSLWQGNDLDRVVLAYLEGGATVRYVLDAWGVAKLKAFARAVADSDLTSPAIRRIVRRELGVSWAEFYEGWVDHVRALP